jgi:geranylgeranyl diphosphate synthase type I
MIEPQSFAALLDRVRPEVERALELAWQSAQAQHAGLGPAVAAPLEAARQLCLRGGKRLRAALVVVGYRLAGGGLELGPCLGVCCAVELMHAYFLIHDDWMDQDELRRGGPAVHARLARQFDSTHLGAAGAVLAGDYTLALATRELARAGVPPERQASVLARFVAMQLDAVVGQQLDVLGNYSGADGAAQREAEAGSPLAEARGGANWEDVYRLKTGSYTVLGPLELGVALRDAAAELAAALEGFALPLGIAFQLRDDLLGAYGDPARTGKPRGSDLIAGKQTLLLSAALADSNASRILGGVVGNPRATRDAVDAALAAMDACGARASVETRIAELTREARTALAQGPFDAAGRSLLEGVLSALVDRGV